jgi:hypothetical protein
MWQQNVSFEETIKNQNLTIFSLKLELESTLIENRNLREKYEDLLVAMAQTSKLHQDATNKQNCVISILSEENSFLKHEIVLEKQRCDDQSIMFQNEILDLTENNRFDTNPNAIDGPNVPNKLNLFKNEIATLKHENKIVHDHMIELKTVSMQYFANCIENVQTLSSVTQNQLMTHREKKKFLQSQVETLEEKLKDSYIAYKRLKNHKEE